jgi:DHA1 family inner membrane transport protein
VVALVIARFVPTDEHRDTPSVRSELAALRSGRLWLSMSASPHHRRCHGRLQLNPLLTERAGISAGAVPLVLIGYGAGALVGTNLGGGLGEGKPLTTVTTAAICSARILLL